MNEQEFYRISSFMQHRYGIDMSQKKQIIQGRLEVHLRMGGWSSCTAYMNAVERDADGRLERELVNLLTTNHTYFMREPEHFTYLRQEVLPTLRSSEAERRDLCIWCGAASSGEEPYTIAMLLKDFFGLEHSRWDTTVLATDISTEVLEQAVAGIYDRERVSPLPESWKRRFLRPIDGGRRYEMTKEIKDEVLFRQFNLMDPFPFRRKMHIIFLRNVMIYFDSETRKTLLGKLYDAMAPGGYLFIGRTETIERNSTVFQMIQPSIFRKPRHED